MPITAAVSAAYHIEAVKIAEYRRTEHLAASRHQGNALALSVLLKNRQRYLLAAAMIQLHKPFTKRMHGKTMNHDKEHRLPAVIPGKRHARIAMEAERFFL